MAKKAYLVTFEVICRVTADTDGRDPNIDEQAWNTVVDEAARIVQPDWGQNVSDICEDTEMPYDPEFD